MDHNNLAGHSAAADTQDHVGTNEMVLFWASFLTLIAAGIGFSVRGAILGNWASEFGFTQSELGTITGGGLAGFGVTIIVLSFVADKIGYGPLMALAFVLHLSSALVTFLAAPIYNQYGKDGVFYCLNISTWLFALGNGTCEAVINPLTATLFPKNRTHWLNILHAGWPGGLILGALLGLGFDRVGNVHWTWQLATFLVPTVAYGALMLGRKFPKSEASASGVEIGTMLLQFASPILLFLLVLHACVGYVELGTDSWIGNITGRILESKESGLWLFIWTSGLMFVLRFFAGPIVHKINPLGLLFASAIFGTAGLLMLGNVTGVALCVVAATVYGIGKTFYWPTMLGVVSERFPKGGALTMGAMGGVGMLSAGLLGGPVIGYKQDYFASTKLQSVDKEAYERFKVPAASAPLPGLPPINGLDGSKVTVLEKGDNKGLIADLATLEKAGAKGNIVDETKKLNSWWTETEEKHAKEDAKNVADARMYGGQMALIYTAFVPAFMAIGYLLLIGYFASTGGYKQVHIGHD
ncbi:MAG: MFS transporter [Planctomycetota bacterium]